MSAARGWRNLWRGGANARDQRPALALEPIGFSARDVQALRAVLGPVGQQLGLRLSLSENFGHIVLLDSEYAASTTPECVRMHQGARPVVRLESVDSAEPWQTAAEVIEHCQQQLLSQLKTLAIVRSQSIHWGAAGWDPEALGADSVSTPPLHRGPSDLDGEFDADFDSRLDREHLLSANLDAPRRSLLNHVLISMHKPHAPPLVAAYGPQATLRFDFEARQVLLDPLAQRQLRVERQLPAPAAADADTLPDPLVRDLEETVWDLGLASGNFALHQAPTDWWHTPLVGVAVSRVGRYSKLPRHLELAGQLAGAPASPSALRRRVRTSVVEVRRFVQAGLFLGLVQWAGTNSR